MLALEISETRDQAFERMVERRQKEMRSLKDVIAELRLRNAELTRANNDLTFANDDLRAHIARAYAHYWQQILVPDNVPVRPRKRSSSLGESSGYECDLFACLDCGSFLLLRTFSAGKTTLQRVGDRELRPAGHTSGGRAEAKSRFSWLRSA
jgi:hypothetical protein